MIRKILMTLSCLIIASGVQAHGPSRLKVTESVTVNAPASDVWGIIGDFCSIEHWHPGVFQCKGSGGNEVGATRTLTIGAEGGARIHEELLKYDARKMTYKYKVTKTANEILPVTTYSSFVSVKDNGDGTSLVEWRGGFYRGHPNYEPPPELNDEAAVKAVTGSYTAGLVEIKRLAEQ